MLRVTIVKVTRSRCAREPGISERICQHFAARVVGAGNVAGSGGSAGGLNRVSGT